MARSLNNVRMGDGTIDQREFEAGIEKIRAAQQRKATADSNLQDAWKGVSGEDSKLQLDKKALKLALQIQAMEPVRQAEFLRNLDNYQHMLGVEVNGDLFEDNKETPGAEAAAAGDAANSNAEGGDEDPNKNTGAGKSKSGGKKKAA